MTHHPARTAMNEAFDAIRDARRSARFERSLTRRIPVLDRDFDNLTFA